MNRIALFVAPLLLGAGLAAVTVPSATASGSSCGSWMNSSQAPDTRAQELMAVMTTAQKESMVHQIGADFADFGAAGYVAAIPSLCIPALVLNDAGSGLGDAQHSITAYPAAISQASSWDPTLQYQMGQSLGGEAAEKSVNVLLAPDVNIARVPMDGRTSEQFGEDPYLSGETAAAFVNGVQSEHVIATVKHFDANNQENARSSINEIVSDRVLHEIYQAPFVTAIDEGHAGAVMCAYNRINGAYSCQNPTDLRTDLDAQAGFKGFVMSDWGATHSTVQSALGGLDMEMDAVQTPDALATIVPNNSVIENYYGSPLDTAVATGKVPMTTLDDMVERILRSMFAVGLFDHPVVAEPFGQLTDADTLGSRMVALQTAEAGTVLLRDVDGVLPLTSADHSIALIGSDASLTGALAVYQAGGSVHVEQPFVATPQMSITQRALLDGDTVNYNDGSSISAAVALAKRSSAAIIYAGYSEAEGNDLANLNFNSELPCALVVCAGAQASDANALIAAVAAVNPHTIVVLNTGGPVLMPWLSKVQGVVEAWYPGEEDGDAAAAVLFGDVDPAGKLPITFPQSMAQLPTQTALQYPGVKGVAVYSEGLLVGYRWYEAKDLKPLFPFGFGLSYTTFRITKASAAPASDGSVTVQATLANTGMMRGADVLQVYVADPAATGEPPEQLKGYQKVTLAPGAHQLVTITIPKSAFEVWDSTHQRWVLDKGCYTLSVGDSSAAINPAGRVCYG